MLKKILSVLAISLAGAAQAAPVVDAGWYGFCFGGAGSNAYSGCQGVTGQTTEFPFVLNLSGSALLKVTDSYAIGDVFNVFVDGSLAFTTSTPGSGGSLSTPDASYESGYYSAGSFLLDAGLHTVNIVALSSPFSMGGAFLELETARAEVPVPATLALAGLGLIGLGWSRRRAAR